MDFFKSRNFFGAIIILLAALAAAGFYILRDINIQNIKPLDFGTEAQIEEQKSAPPEITEVPKLQIPALDRPTAFSASVSEETRKQLVFDISEVSGTLRGNYNYLQGWLQLGILRKAAGDYDGAVEAWEFAGLLRPQSAISFLNLADLYGYYIHDNQKAEESFSKAISAEPQNSFPYFQAANFYGDVLKEKEKAKDILRQGISAGADPSGDLQSLLNSI